MFVNLRVVDGSKSSIEEVSKYVVKDSDFSGSAWVPEFTQLYSALSHVRCFSPAGCWRDSRRALGFVDPDKDSLTDDVSSGGKIVALRKESVDRNTFFQVCIVTGRCRSPQGERG